MREKSRQRSEEARMKKCRDRPAAGSAAAPGQNEGLKRDKTLVSFHKFTSERLSEPQLSADQFQFTSL